MNINDILDDSKTQINNIEKDEGVISFDYSTINMLSEKLIEQYEARIKDLQDINKQLQEQLNYLKHNKQ